MKNEEKSAAYQRLEAKCSVLESRGLYRRAADMWRTNLTINGLTEKERDLCATNAGLCSRQAKYTGKPEVL